ncbi:MAG: cytochrome c [Gammaproteobacteria bacterium]|nr:cytochrome c [Gammaproteobacteria bacterium]
MTVLHTSPWTIGALLLLLFGLNTAFAQDPAAPASDGKELYLSYQCWQCHGYEGQGGAAARLAGKQYPYAAFARFVRHPNLMPAYPPNLLSDEKLRRIFDYVRSIPEPPPLEDIPALRENK